MPEKIKQKYAYPILGSMAMTMASFDTLGYVEVSVNTNLTMRGDKPSTPFVFKSLTTLGISAGAHVVFSYLIAGGIWGTVQIMVFRVYAKKTQTHPPVLLWLVTGAAADMLITGALQSVFEKNRPSQVRQSDLSNHNL
ncbi:hypothetical protein B0H34DRAFT_492977 [Crassisporium funariophilum]|nr:hypothetical protein B0H34DRAFT_492977 [Crassisporium funariophilum]